jgi:hypothetical protein
MATVFYIRKGSKQDKIASSRDVSVEDLLGLYGSSPHIYKYMKGADSPAASAGRRPSTPDPDADHVVVRIEASEINKEIFPQEGFYRVDVVPDSE